MSKDSGNADARSVRLYREASWPAGAPAPSTAIARGRGLRSAIEQRLHLSGSTRTVGRVTITANQRVSMRLRHGQPPSVDLRVHWALLEHSNLADEIALAVESGAFSERCAAIMNAAAEGLPDDYSYASSRPRARPDGAWIKLGDVLRAVSRHLPAELPDHDVRITWGRYSAARNKRQRNIRLGSYAPRHRLIRIHPVLDSPWVPTHVLEFVVFHELCHWAAPPLTRATASAQRKHRVHHSDFAYLESLYPEAESAERWISEHVQELLRAAAEKRRYQ